MEDKRVVFGVEVRVEMSSFTKKPALRLLPDGETWELLEPFEYHVGSEDSAEIVAIPKGFITDGASIPKIFWSFIGGQSGKYFYAAILHDYLYHIKIYTRSRSDKIFYEAMGILGVPNWKRSIMHLAVRIAGWIPWKNRKPLFPIILLILLCLFNVSCASLTLEYKDDKIYQIKGRGLQTSKIKPDGTIEFEMKIDWLPTIPIYKD